MNDTCKSRLSRSGLYTILLQQWMWDGCIVLGSTMNNKELERGHISQDKEYVFHCQYGRSKLSMPMTKLKKSHCQSDNTTLTSSLFNASSSCPNAPPPVSDTCPTTIANHWKRDPDYCPVRQCKAYKRERVTATNSNMEGGGNQERCFVYSSKGTGNNAFWTRRHSGHN